VEDALPDPDWVVAMQEELNNFKHNKMWCLVERSKLNVMGTKWVLLNKQDEHGVVIRNKAKLVAKGYSQVKGLNFDKTFPPIGRLESICILLAYATHHCFKVYQMDIKSAFLNGLIKEEVYVEHRALKMKNILTMCTNYIRRSMDLGKLQVHGMNAIETFLLKMVLGLVRRILLSSLEEWTNIYLYVKHMLLISFLVLLINLFVISLVRS
jgi:hypothetical protein